MIATGQRAFIVSRVASVSIAKSAGEWKSRKGDLIWTKIAVTVLSAIIATSQRAFIASRVARFFARSVGNQKKIWWLKMRSTRAQRVG
tara:strand:- start:251 stop:514 length:264 start_codon:yes stop_codon:yes gene_type:complete